MCVARLCPKLLLEPVVRIRLVVEGVDLAVARGPVQADRLREHLVRLEPDDVRAGGGGAALELAQQPATDPQTTNGVGDPHAFQLRWLIAVELEAAAADRVRTQGRNQEHTGRRPELMELRGDTECGVESGLETPAKLDEVLAEAHLRVGMGRVDGSDLDQRVDAAVLHWTETTSCATLNLMVHYPTTVDRAFAALADPNRRAVLERLGSGGATISELAEPFGMSLTGMKKHIRLLEEAQLVTTEKVGRVRRCMLAPYAFEGISTWLQRLDRFAQVVERTKGDR